jgi:hypothetical protein
MIAASLSKNQINLVTSPNRYASLSDSSESSLTDSTDSKHVLPTTDSSNKKSFSKKPVYAKLAPWAKEHAKLHQCFCTREKCYWHHYGDMFDEKEYQDHKGNPQVSQETSELPNTGSQRQERALKSEQRTSIQSLKCETADGSEWSSRSTSKQNSQK